MTALTGYWSHHFLPGGVRFAVPLLQGFVNQALLSAKIAHSLSAATNDVLLVLCLGIAALGFYTVWRQKPRQHPMLLAAGLFCVSYFMVHVFWHADTARYAIPLIPFLLVFMVRGLERAG